MPVIAVLIQMAEAYFLQIIQRESCPAVKYLETALVIMELVFILAVVRFLLKELILGAAQAG